MSDLPTRAELEANLRRYMDLLMERNRTLNLTAMRDPEKAWDKLILGSLVVLDAHHFRGDERVADVGSGAGLPGIPMLMALPTIRLTLIESDQRKADFLRDVAASLALQLEVDSRRAEDVGQDPEYREVYDAVLTRAAAKAAVAAELCLPLVRPGGVVLALARARDWGDARRAIGQLGGHLRETRAGVVIIDKVRSTPAGFPRRPGIPGKRPL
jgi:16S rRNA (guanine527-N7)-methyltransferase